MKFRTTLTTMFALILFGGAAQAFGNSATSKYVDDVKLTFTGMAAKVRVENQAANKHVSNVNLKVKDSALSFEFSGTVHCNPGIGRHYRGAYATFGPVNLQGEGINTNNGAHTASAEVAYTEKKNEVVEYMVDTFNVPLSKLKNASPSLRVDPLAEIEKKLQQHLQGGGKAVDFYKQDHTIVLQRPISLSALCGTSSKSSGGYETKNHVIQIEYKGDPKVYEVAKLNAAIANNLPNQIGNNLPFKLDNAEFQANMPSYVGKCIPSQNPKIRINFQTSGSETGLMDLRVVAVSNQYAAYGNYFATQGIVNNPKNGGSHLDFRFPLKEMLAQDKYSWMAIANNDTHSHNMRIEVRYKNMQNGTWSPYKQFGTAVFKHRCAPQLNPGLGTPGNQIKNFDQEPKTKLNIQRAPIEESREAELPKRAPVEKPKRAVLQKPERASSSSATTPLQLKKLEENESPFIKRQASE